MKHLIVCLFFFVSACVTPTPPTASFGIQEAYRSYIPAKTVVLACQFWPETSNFPAHPQSNISEKDRASFCPSVDEYVLEGFRGQTFMRGHTPKAVNKALLESGKMALVGALSQLWRFEAARSASCADIPAYYNGLVKPRREWRQWLLEMSAATYQSDAILIPFMAFAREDKINDRGLLLAKRALGVVLLLIDTQSGDLIWAGNRQSTMSRQRLVDQVELTYPDFPPWSGLVREILIDALWREYPGKIFF